MYLGGPGVGGVLSLELSVRGELLLNTLSEAERLAPS